ncbi:MAG: histidinol-phosphate transaminase, partial [Mariprofundaceae bacterium]|nr:histidinol-phosphate transaminase [Mariprofundaceae bacterium]
MIRNDIKQLAAYHVPDASGLIKLDAMENPYPLPDVIRDEWAGHIRSLNINRYPDAEMIDLRHAIANREGLRTSQVLLGNGSDEIIQMALIAADQGACVIPQPTFVMYETISRWLRRPVASVPLEKDFSLNADSFLRVCAREKAAIAFLACPNNPTGNMWPRDTIRKIADNFRGILVIDEAYHPFAGDTYADMISPHMIVLRTFSKLGMAGLRLGYALGRPDTIAELNKVRLPYNINSPGQASARFFLEHFHIFDEQTKKICRERDRLAGILENMKNIEAYSSRANFILLRVPNANSVFEALKQHGILVKNLHAQGGLLGNCLRVTIGIPEENDQFIVSLK